MISAAKSDGHLDSEEQKFIFSSVEKLNLDAAGVQASDKGYITVDEYQHESDGMEGLNTLLYIIPLYD